MSKATTNDEKTKQRFTPHKRAFYNKKFGPPLKRKRKNQYNPKEEARLERIIFGDPVDIIEHLPTKDDLKSDEELLNDSVKNNESHEVDSSHRIDKDDEDTAKNNSQDDEDEEDEEEEEEGEEEKSEDDRKKKKKPAWVDEDDVQCSMEDAFHAQNRKPYEGRPEKIYKEYLENKYKGLVGTPKWAELQKTDPDMDDLDKDILKHSCHLEKPKLKNLPKNLIDIKALTPINKATHTEGPVVSTVEFHPTSTVAMVAGSSGILSLFQVDGIENNKLHTLQYKKFPITCGNFLRDGTEVLIGSKYYPHCHSYNLMTGKTYKVPLPHGINGMPNCEVSPDGKLLAVRGRFGDIHLLISSTKELIGTLKMNATCKALAFTPDSKTLISHGDESEIYFWDINTRSCIHRAIDEGCLSASSLAISPTGQFLATGSKEGVVNLYDMKTVQEQKTPVPLKVVLNLVTAVTAVKFNPTSEILAFASNKKHNAFRMLHLPSFTVFSNFPTFQTNIVMPEAINFSPHSGYLGLTNRSSSAFLYRLKHYGDY